MMNRDFNQWLSTMKDSIATWNYYCDFEKAYNNVLKYKNELILVDALAFIKDKEEIKKEFAKLIIEFPKLLNVIPILMAKRETKIKINDSTGEYIFDFKTMNYPVEMYVDFMEKTGLFDFIQNKLSKLHSPESNAFDYVLGIEIGMDTNARKNRTGDSMEDLVESYLIKNGLIKGVSYFKEMTKTNIEKKFHIDLSAISNNGKTEKRFDFVIYKNNHVYGCECNFYGGSGSKLNETARSYKTLALEANEINGFSFVWFTDGIGWNYAKHNLEETFDVLDTIYNLNDLENGALDLLLKDEEK